MNIRPYYKGELAQAYETKVDAHFQLYLSYVKYLKAAGKLTP